MVGEFYMTSSDNRSGNKNSSSGFPVTKTQRTRADGFSNALRSMVTIPYVVGADWFQYSDEPANGRGDGENYNMGLVDINDRPYEELTAAAAGLDRYMLHAQPPPARPDANHGVPPAPAEPLAHWKPMEAMIDWDRERGFGSPISKSPCADLYMCWDPDAVYVGVFAKDVLEAGCYKDKKLPESDRAEWTVTVGGRKIRARVGNARPPAAGGANVTIVDTTAIDHGVYHSAAIRLPASLFGKQKLSAGDTIRIASVYNTASRAEQVTWNGSFKLIQ